MFSIKYTEWQNIEGVAFKPELLEWIKSEIESGNLEGPREFQSKVLTARGSGRQFIGEELPRNGKTILVGLEVTNWINTIPRDSDITPDPESELNYLQALVIGPEHECALKAKQMIRKMTTKLKLDVMTAIGGGHSFNSNKRSIDNGVHVICATPGRLAHLVRSEELPGFLDNVNFVVIEDYDIIRDDHGIDGFREDMNTIFAALDKTKVSLHFMASIASDDIRKELHKEVEEMDQTNYIDERPMAPSIEYIPTYIKNKVIYCRGEADKMEALEQILNDLQLEKMKILMFANSNECVQKLYEQLLPKKSELGTGEVIGYGAKVLNQSEREKASQMIETAPSFICISTNLKSRNEDVVFSMVIHYDLAFEVKEFIQRSSRLINKRKETKYNVIFASKSVSDRRLTLDDKLLDKVEDDYGVRIDSCSATSIKGLFE